MTFSKIATLIFSALIFNIGIAQSISRVFTNVALPNEKDLSSFLPIDTTMRLDALKISFPNSDEVIHTYRYGTPKAYQVRFKRLKDAGFSNVPNEIRGHKLMGVYYDSSTNFYDLYYLSPARRPSLLILNYWSPKQLAIFRYLCTDTINPFKDMRFNASLNSTVELKSKH